jgi:dihydrolipoamide dehydrogenase
VPNEDEAVSTELARAFTKRGIHVRTSTTVTSAAVTNGSVRIVMESASGQAESLVVDKLLVAVGRAPVTDGLGVEDAGLALDRGFIVVDAHYRTNVPGISAIGDVITMGNGPHPQLAHVSSAEGVRVAERIAGRDAPPIDYDQVPACTYCDPEIGSVGLTEAEAKARGYDVRVGTFPFSALGRARIAGETDGFVKIVGEARYDQLLGVHIIGGRATELVAEAAAALRLEATVDDLVRTIHAHPTMSEAVGEAAHALHGGAINL